MRWEEVVHAISTELSQAMYQTGLVVCAFEERGKSPASTPQIDASFLIFRTSEELTRGAEVEKALFENLARV